MKLSLNSRRRKQGRAQDSMLDEHSSTLYLKAVDSAFDITNKALDIVKDSTFEKMDGPGQDESTYTVKL